MLYLGPNKGTEPQKVKTLIISLQVIVECDPYNYDQKLHPQGVDKVVNVTHLHIEFYLECVLCTAIAAEKGLTGAGSVRGRPRSSDVGLGDK